MKEYRFKINGKDYKVNVNGIHDGQADVTVNGTGYTVNVDSVPASAGSTALRQPLSKADNGKSPETGNTDGIPVSAASPSWNHRLGNTQSATGGKKIEAPLPGVIISLNVTPGQAVKRGQRIAVLEAMKMENDILSPIDGTIMEILAQRGDSVLEGATIATIA